MWGSTAECGSCGDQLLLKMSSPAASTTPQAAMVSFCCGAPYIGGLQAPCSCTTRPTRPWKHWTIQMSLNSQMLLCALCSLQTWARDIFWCSYRTELGYKWACQEWGNTITVMVQSNSLLTVPLLNPMFSLVFSPSGGLGTCPGCCLDKSSFPTLFSMSQCLCFLICLWRAAYFSLWNAAWCQHAALVPKPHAPKSSQGEGKSYRSHECTWMRTINRWMNFWGRVWALCYLKHSKQD